MARLTAIVLGSAAGGGFPQWNCRCAVCRRAWDGDLRVKRRTQTSLAVSADGRRWSVLNASPDLRAQIGATRALQPHDGTRSSPIEAVVLTGGEIDQTAGLLSLRERQAFSLYATAETLQFVDANPMFGALAPDLVARRAVALEEPFTLARRDRGAAVRCPRKAPALSRRRNPGDQHRVRPPMSGSSSRRTPRGSPSCQAAHRCPPR